MAQNHKDIAIAIMDILGLKNTKITSPFYVDLNNSQFFSEKYKDDAPINKFSIIDNKTQSTIMELILKHLTKDSIVYFMYATVACRRCQGEGVIHMGDQKVMCNECFGGSKHLTKFKDLVIPNDKYKNLLKALEYD